MFIFLPYICGDSVLFKIIRYSNFVYFCLLCGITTYATYRNFLIFFIYKIWNQSCLKIPIFVVKIKQFLSLLWGMVFSCCIIYFQLKFVSIIWNNNIRVFFLVNIFHCESSSENPWHEVFTTLGKTAKLSCNIDFSTVVSTTWSRYNNVSSQESYKFIAEINKGKITKVKLFLLWWSCLAIGQDDGPCK